MTKPIAVLFVGGVESDTRLMLRTLKKGGYKPALEQVKTPAQMRRALKKADWEVILSTNQSSKLEAATALKILQETGLNIPFIVVSDSLGEEAAVAIMRAGASDCVQKDNLKRLVPTVERELRHAAKKQELRQRETALQESEDKYKYAFDHSATGKSITLPSGEINVNQAFCKMLGYTQGELKNKKWQEITHPEDLELTQRVVDSLMSGEKKSARINKRFIHKNGSTVWVDLRTVLRRAGDGKPLYLLTTMNDITERVQAEEALRELSSRQEAILAAVPDILMEVNRDKVYTWANPSGLEFFGKDVVGKKADYYFEGEQATYDAVTPLFQGSNDVIYVESWQRRKDGKNRLLAWWCRALKDIDGDVRGALSSAHDITGTRQTEETIHNLARFPSENPNPVLRIARDGNLIYANQAAFLLLENWKLKLGKHVPEVLNQPAREVFNTRIAKTVEIAYGVQTYSITIAPALEDKDINLYALDITERKRAEEKLKESEERFRSLFENSTIGMYRTTPKGRILLANPALVKMLGYKSFEELSQRDLDSEGYEPEYPRLEFQNHIEQEGEVRGLESAWKRKDGSFMFVRESARFVRDDKNQPLYYEGTVEDITERKVAEKALKQSEEKYRQLIENSIAGIYIIQDAKMAYVNPSFARAFGYSPDEIIGKLSPKDLIHPDDIQAVMRRLQERMGGKTEESSIAYKAIKKDGSIIYIEVYGMGVDFQDRPAVMGTLMDITKRKQAEEAVRQSEEKFRLSFMTGMDAFYWSTLEDGKIIEVNPVFEKVWGYTRDETIGKTSLQLGLYQDPIDRAKMISQLKEKGTIQDLILKGKRKDGRLITISLSGSIMTIDNQRYILGVIRDITEMKRSEQQKETLYQVLRAVSSQLEPDLIALSAVKTIVRFTGYPHVCIALPDETGTHWSVRGAAGKLAAELGATYPIHKGVIGNAFNTGKTQWVRDVTKDPHYVNDVKAPGGPALRSEYVALIRRGDDLLGALNVESDHADAFDDDDARMIQSAADIISLALQNARLYRDAQQEIAERKRMEQALQESEQRFRVIFETANDGLLITNDKSEILDVNPHYCEMLGYSRAELLKMQVPDVQAPEVRQSGNVLKKEMVLHGNTFFEGLVIDRSGRRIPVEISVGHVELPSGGFYVSVVRDITERKQADLNLRVSEDKFSKLFHSSPDAIILSELKSGKIIEVNRSFESYSGYSRDELIGHPVLEFDMYSPADRQMFVTMVKEQGSIRNAEFTLNNKQGEVLIVMASADLIEVNHELHTITILRDITERKQAQTLQEALYRIAAAAETTQSLEDLYPQIHQIISSVMPAENFFITLYDEAQNMLRFPYFKDAEDEPFMGGIQPARGLSAYVLRTGKSLLCTQAVHDELERQGEVKLLGASSAIWLGVPLIVEGKTIGAMVVQHYTDPKAYGEREQHMLEFVSTQVGIAITRKQSEEEIRQLNASLEKRVEERTRELRLAQEKIVRQEKLALLGQLAGGVGHELRNPLGIISNAIYYLKFIQPDADEKVKQYHAMIEQEVHNSEKIITDLLDFARLESMEKEAVAVSELVQRTLARFPVPEIIQTTVNIPTDLPNVFTDLRQMEQVLGNLTVNACQAMLSPRGTMPLRPTAGGVKRGELTISAINRKGMVAIAVKDTGTGITPENMEKLFEPLFTTKSKGIGLGLAVSKKLAEANGGRIEVKSVPGKGSTFTLVLPVQQKDTPK